MKTVTTISLVLFLLAIPGCTKSRAPELSPEVQIIQQLSQRRIVMMGDFAHDFPLPYHGLISTLETWRSMLKSGESRQNQLVLFLEEDGQVTSLLSQYLKTGDLNPVLEFLLPSTSIERLEFYRELRRIAESVDSMNATLPQSRQIFLDIQGPEARNILDPALIDSSRRASLLYYVRDRDSLTADNVIRYLQNHPQSKALMFFGTAHLLAKEMRKDYTGTLDPAESKGVYLGYYLKRAFGQSQVFTISQVARTQFPGNSGILPARDAFYPAEDVPWKDAPPNDDNLLPENYDAFNVRDGLVVRSHPLGVVFSQKVADAALRRLAYAEPHREGAMGSRLYREALRTLSFLYDTSFATAAAWRAWCSKHPPMGLDHFASDEYRARFAERSSGVLGTSAFSRYIDDLIDLGFDPRVGSPGMSREQWNAILSQQWQQLLALNAIGVYWIGEPQEQQKAKQYLVGTTSNDFSDPDQYLKWWRRQFFSATY